jgi:UDP-2,3-diacylglucosamine hydrolase
MDSAFTLQNNKKVYFLSDLHLGLYPADVSQKREKKAVQWLDMIKADAQVLFLLGDVFDYWFEYKYVTRQGFVRFLGKLAEVADSGVEIHLFCGNHDMWYFNYLKKEIGLMVHRDSFAFTVGDKKFLTGHGDGLGPGDWGYKLMKIAFRNIILRWIFAHLIHPDFSMWVGQ